MTIRCEIVSEDRMVFEGDVDIVVLPGTEGEMGVLQFGYTIVNPGKHDIDALTKDENFSTMMGDILTEILTKNQYETPRENDTEEFDLQ